MSDQFNEKNIGFEPGAEPRSPGCPNGQLYTVKPGDTMFFIAKRFNVSLQEMINANPQIPDPNVIFPGQILCVPAPFPMMSCPNGQIYQVERGDTMFEIAGRFGVSLDALIAANPQIPDPNLIFPGQEICVPVMEPLPVPPPIPVPVPAPIPVPVSCPNGMLYTVKPGDTMYEIALANNIALSALIMANPQISDPNLIYPGQVICVPAAPVSIPAPAPLPIMPAPLPAPAPIAPICPQPQPVPRPRIPAPLPAPTPAPVAPICPSPIPMPRPIVPAPMPCPVGPGMMCPMPVYIAVPWEECPYRSKKKKHGHHDRCKRCERRERQERRERRHRECRARRCR